MIFILKLALKYLLSLRTNLALFFKTILSSLHSLFIKVELRKEVFYLLNFNELLPKDKRRRYRWTMDFPSSVLLFLLTLLEVNYLFICIVFASSTVISLFFYGLLNEKKNYSFTDWLADSLILYSLTSLQVLAITPVLKDFIGISFENSYYANIYSILLSIAVIYIFWYLVLKIQQRFFKNKHNWKWSISGMINSSTNFENWNAE